MRIFLFLLVILLIAGITIFLVRKYSAEQTNHLPSIDTRLAVHVPRQHHAATQDSSRNWEWPAINDREEVIIHTGFSLVYDENHEQARWVAYELTKEETLNESERSNNFRPDPKIRSRSACYEDYTKSGYDRGHLAPASDMGWSEASMSESFYYSNMSPQNLGFNRGIWKKLETQARSWAKEHEAIYIVTGPVLTDGLPRIGPNEVSVPLQYYKVLLDYREPGLRGIGFILPNEASKLPLENFAVSIDSVEALTGINFFPCLPDSIISSLERECCYKCW
jgi:endonuclease G